MKEYDKNKESLYLMYWDVNTWLDRPLHKEKYENVIGLMNNVLGSIIFRNNGIILWIKSKNI